MEQTRYIIGIDLGTTNCAVAYVDTHEAEDQSPKIRIFPLPQIVDPGHVEERNLLPSFSYQAAPEEFPQGSLDLPWKHEKEFAVGVFARERGAEVPDRVICSSKSWLSFAGADRTAPLLPWGAPEEIPHVSPIEASSRLLRHIRDAWNHAMTQETPESALESQEIYLTVPASFDATARELTVRAAYAYGPERYGSRQDETFNIAIDLMRDWGPKLKPLLSSPYELSEYRQALASALNTGDSRAAKTVFAIDQGGA